jgi:hypothetical protein
MGRRGWHRLPGANVGEQTFDSSFVPRTCPLAQGAELVE